MYDIYNNQYWKTNIVHVTDTQWFTILYTVRSPFAYTYRSACIYVLYVYVCVLLLSSRRYSSTIRCLRTIHLQAYVYVYGVRTVYSTVNHCVSFTCVENPKLISNITIKMHENSYWCVCKIKMNTYVDSYIKRVEYMCSF